MDGAMRLKLFLITLFRKGKIISAPLTYLRIFIFIPTSRILDVDN